ncbi:MAG: outer membrane protein transport protein [Mariprofundales bacterium]
MRLIHICAYICVVTLLSISFHSTHVHGAAFAQDDQSAAGTALVNAFVASADDASAAHYNPAAIAWQEGINLAVGSVISYQNNSMRLPLYTAPNVGSPPIMQHLYLNWMPWDSRWGISLAFNKPYAFESRWQNEFSQQATMTQFSAQSLSLAGIYQPRSNLAIAVGLDVWQTKAKLQRSGSAMQELKDNSSIGGKAALLWKFAPYWRFGITARRGANTQAGNIPDTLQAGVAWDIRDSVRLELDSKITRWAQAMDADNPLLANLLSNVNMRDNVDIMLGMTWYWRPDAQIRLGYGRLQSANESSGFHPAFADVNANRFGFGLGMTLFDIHWDMAYAQSLMSRKQVSMSIPNINGTYRERRQTLDFTATYHF